MSLASIKGYLLEEEHIHLFFVVSLWAKGLLALSEIISGLAAFFVTKQFLVALAVWVTKHELTEDPHDVVANFFLHSVQSLSIGTQYFAAVYLLVHGVVKFWLIVGLLRQRLGYYPSALVVFGLFIAYQLYRYTFTHSIWLLLITLIDVVVMGLTWHEWGYLRRERLANG